MAYDTFLDIKEVPGESTAKGMEKKIEIYSFGFGASNPVTIGSGATGMGGGKATLSTFNVMKKTESSSPLLFSACAKGDHFPKAVVTLRKAGGAAGQIEFLKYEFEKVYVQDINWSGSSGGDDAPSESVSFAFGKVTITYTPQDAAGKAGSPIVKSWDVTTVAE
jgi:type VI secretion system secreted protein Hcp